MPTKTLFIVLLSLVLCVLCNENTSPEGVIETGHIADAEPGHVVPIINNHGTVHSSHENTHDLSEPDQDYFSFTLKEPLFDKISRDGAQHYREPGWTILDSRNREVDVSIDIPLEMRRQRPGNYEITYTAFDKASNEELGTQKRICQVYDIDECIEGTHDCSVNADCIHLPTGGYTCVCKDGYRGSGRVCNDIDECAEGTHNCDIHSTCVNTPGSYRCECHPGFEKQNGICVDIDECATGKHDCSVHAECKNIPGSYKCTCLPGYEGDGKVCTQINKCNSGELNCHPYSVCVELDNGEYKCECRPGFEGDGVHSCEDIDECELGTYNCPEHSHCRNTFGGYQCICNHGFHDQGGYCVDIDECEDGSHTCPPNSNCYNTIGGYDCICKDGYTRTEDGRCEDLTGIPQLTLKGDNPMTINLFDTYSEPGFLLEEEKDDISIFVRIPPQLHGTARHCGTFQITYHAKDVVKTRIVHVKEVDQCKLPDTHPYSHQCNRYARCIFLPGQCDYTCQCAVGFEGNGFGPDGCKDVTPPVFAYDGPDPFIRQQCEICGEQIAKPDLTLPVITRAYDTTPLGKVDVSDRIVLETRPSDLGDDCLLHHYTVKDDSGNEASRLLNVCLVVEDMRTVILELQAMYHWQMWLIRSTAFVFFLAFVLFCIWEFGHFVASCVRVFLGVGASHDDKDIAYSLWYKVTHPFAPREDIRQYVNQKVI